MKGKEKEIHQSVRSVILKKEIRRCRVFHRRVFEGKAKKQGGIKDEKSILFSHCVFLLTSEYSSWRRATTGANPPHRDRDAYCYDK
jgi:hypothetical protein